MAPKLDKYFTGSWRRRGLLANRVKPEDLLLDTSIKVWLDATDTSTVYLEGGAAYEWYNKADKAFMLRVERAETSRRPVLVPDVIDGYSILRGTRSADTSMMGSFAAALSQINTIFIVARRTVLNAFSEYFLDSNTANRNAIFTQGNTLRLQAFAGASVTSTQSTQEWGIWVVKFDGATSEMWRNGASLTTGNMGVNSMEGLTVFNYQGDGFGLDGDIAEIIICDGDRSPGTTAGDVILDYLTEKYPSAWQPETIFGSALSSWYEPEILITQSSPGNTNPIDTLDNIQGSATWDLTGVTTERPRRIDGASPNGRRVARFDGIANVLQAAGVPISNPEHVFFVYRTAAPGSAGYVYDSVSNFGNRTGRVPNTNQLTIYHGGINFSVSLSGHDSWHRMEFLHNGTVANGSSIVEDGVSAGTGTCAAPTGITGLSVGAAFNKTGSLACDLAFLCIVNRQATAAELQLIRDYMGTV